MKVLSIKPNDYIVRCTDYGDEKHYDIEGETLTFIDNGNTYRIISDNPEEKAEICRLIADLFRLLDDPNSEKKCTTCASEKTYLSLALHCNRCASTDEV